MGTRDHNNRRLKATAAYVLSAFERTEGGPGTVCIDPAREASGEAWDLLHAAADASGCPVDAHTSIFVADALRAVSLYGPLDPASDAVLSVLTEEVHYDELHAWAASHPRRLDLCEPAMRELAEADRHNILDLLNAGNLAERRSVYRAVLEALDPEHATPPATPPPEEVYLAAVYVAVRPPKGDAHKSPYDRAEEALEMVLHDEGDGPVALWAYVQDTEGVAAVPRRALAARDPETGRLLPESVFPVLPEPGWEPEIPF